ncbi:hypothetical protein DUNSADRAFT_14684 [Dunaliella salina]|uniref:ATP-dependent helicase Rep n=1 Tax=Dunaliella salina TaxID=3046 RepID=A0ABQ7G6Z8_DUNSA|nr:hypothetical protein DUNSADRAFT_14684 [Dunaliella salina]|eukprot:KAF5830371.1 hypothetical protein DUNSADRAFT_14684 [Dunaliella salina]
MANRSIRARSWISTCNNPDKHYDDVPQVEGLKHLVYQLEVGDSGTYHWQIYTNWENQKTSKFMAQWMPHTDHRPVTENTRDTVINYCKKEIDYDDRGQPKWAHRIAGPWEFGTSADKRERAGTSDSFQAAVACAKRGRIRHVIMEHPGEFVKHHAGLQKLVAFHAEKRTWKTFVEIHYGDARTGKSRYAFENHPGLYRVNCVGKNPWYDGYDNQDVVLYDEFYGQMCFAELKQIMDRYEMQVPVKQAFANFAPRKIIFTSNTCPTEWYKRLFEKQVHREAFIERIEKVVKYTGNARHHTTEEVDLRKLFEEQDEKDDDDLFEKDDPYAPNLGAPIM